MQTMSPVLTHSFSVLRRSPSVHPRPVSPPPPRQPSTSPKIAFSTGVFPKLHTEQEAALHPG